MSQEFLSDLEFSLNATPFDSSDSDYDIWHKKAESIDNTLKRYNIDNPALADQLKAKYLKEKPPDPGIWSQAMRGMIPGIKQSVADLGMGIGASLSSPHLSAFQQAEKDGKFKPGMSYAEKEEIARKIAEDRAMFEGYSKGVDPSTRKFIPFGIHERPKAGVIPSMIGESLYDVSKNYADELKAEDQKRDRAETKEEYLARQEKEGGLIDKLQAWPVEKGYVEPPGQLARGYGRSVGGQVLPMTVGGVVAGVGAITRKPSLVNTGLGLYRAGTPLATSGTVAGSMYDTIAQNDRIENVIRNQIESQYPPEELLKPNVKAKIDRQVKRQLDQEAKDIVGRAFSERLTSPQTLLEFAGTFQQGGLITNLLANAGLEAGSEAFDSALEQTYVNRKLRELYRKEGKTEKEIDELVSYDQIGKYKIDDWMQIVRGGTSGVLMSGPTAVVETGLNLLQDKRVQGKNLDDDKEMQSLKDEADDLRNAMNFERQVNLQEQKLIIEQEKTEQLRLKNQGGDTAPTAQPVLDQEEVQGAYDQPLTEEQQQLLENQQKVLNKAREMMQGPRAVERNDTDETARVIGQNMGPEFEQLFRDEVKRISDQNIANFQADQDAPIAEGATPDLAPIEQPTMTPQEQADVQALNEQMLNPNVINPLSPEEVAESQEQRTQQLRQEELDADADETLGVNPEDIAPIGPEQTVEETQNAREELSDAIRQREELEAWHQQNRDTIASRDQVSTDDDGNTVLRSVRSDPDSDTETIPNPQEEGGPSILGEALPQEQEEVETATEPTRTVQPTQRLSKGLADGIVALFKQRFPNFSGDINVLSNEDFARIRGRDASKGVEGEYHKGEGYVDILYENIVGYGEDQRGATDRLVAVLWHEGLGHKGLHQGLNDASADGRGYERFIDNILRDYGDDPEFIAFVDSLRQIDPNISERVGAEEFVVRKFAEGNVFGVNDEGKLLEDSNNGNPVTQGILENKFIDSLIASFKEAIGRDGINKGRLDDRQIRHIMLGLKLKAMGSGRNVINPAFTPNARTEQADEIEGDEMFMPEGSEPQILRSFGRDVEVQRSHNWPKQRLNWSFKVGDDTIDVRASFSANLSEIISGRSMGPDGISTYDRLIDVDPEFKRKVDALGVDPKKQVMELSFDREDMAGVGRYDTTGGGNQYDIFSGVAIAFRELMGKRPETVMFTAEEKVQNVPENRKVAGRVRLYDRFVKKLADEFGYKPLSHVYEGGLKGVYVLHKPKTSEVLRSQRKPIRGQDDFARRAVGKRYASPEEFSDSGLERTQTMNALERLDEYTRQRRYEEGGRKYLPPRDNPQIKNIVDQWLEERKTQKQGQKTKFIELFKNVREATGERITPAQVEKYRAWQRKQEKNTLRSVRRPQSGIESYMRSTRPASERTPNPYNEEIPPPSEDEEGLPNEILKATGRYNLNRQLQNLSFKARSRVMKDLVGTSDFNPADRDEILRSFTRSGEHPRVEDFEINSSPGSEIFDSSAIILDVFGGRNSFGFEAVGNHRVPRSGVGGDADTFEQAGFQLDVLSNVWNVTFNINGSYSIENHKVRDPDTGEYVDAQLQFPSMNAVKRSLTELIENYGVDGITFTGAGAERVRVYDIGFKKLARQYGFNLVNLGDEDSKSYYMQRKGIENTNPVIPTTPDADAELSVLAWQSVLNMDTVLDQNIELKLQNLSEDDLLAQIEAEQNDLDLGDQLQRSLHSGYGRLHYKVKEERDERARREEARKIQEAREASYDLFWNFLQNPQIRSQLDAGQRLEANPDLLGWMDETTVPEGFGEFLTDEIKNRSTPDKFYRQMMNYGREAGFIEHTVGYDPDVWRLATQLEVFLNAQADFIHAPESGTLENAHGSWSYAQFFDDVTSNEVDREVDPATRDVNYVGNSEMREFISRVIRRRGTLGGQAQNPQQEYRYDLDELTQDPTYNANVLGAIQRHSDEQILGGRSDWSTEEEFDRAHEALANIRSFLNNDDRHYDLNEEFYLGMRREVPAIRDSIEERRRIREDAQRVRRIELRQIAEGRERYPWDTNEQLVYAFNDDLNTLPYAEREQEIQRMLEEDLGEILNDGVGLIDDMNSSEGRRDFEGFIQTHIGNYVARLTESSYEDFVNGPSWREFAQNRLSELGVQTFWDASESFAEAIRSGRRNKDAILQTLDATRGFRLDQDLLSEEEITEEDEALFGADFEPEDDPINDPDDEILEDPDDQEAQRTVRARDVTDVDLQARFDNVEIASNRAIRRRERLEEYNNANNERQIVKRNRVFELIKDRLENAVRNTSDNYLQQFMDGQLNRVDFFRFLGLKAREDVFDVAINYPPEMLSALYSDRLWTDWVRESVTLNVDFEAFGSPSDPEGNSAKEQFQMDLTIGMGKGIEDAVRYIDQYEARQILQSVRPGVKLVDLNNMVDSDHAYVSNFYLPDGSKIEAEARQPRQRKDLESSRTTASDGSENPARAILQEQGLNLRKRLEYWNISFDRDGSIDIAGDSNEQHRVANGVKQFLEQIIQKKNPEAMWFTAYDPGLRKSDDGTFQLNPRKRGARIRVYKFGVNQIAREYGYTVGLFRPDLENGEFYLQRNDVIGNPNEWDNVEQLVSEKTGRETNYIGMTTLKNNLGEIIRSFMHDTQSPTEAYIVMRDRMNNRMRNALVQAYDAVPDFFNDGNDSDLVKYIVSDIKNAKPLSTPNEQILRSHARIPDPDVNPPTVEEATQEMNEPVGLGATGIGRWAHSVMNYLKGRHLGDLKDEEAYLIGRYRALGEIARMTELGQRFYEIFHEAKNPKEIYEFLTTQGANPEMIPDARERSIAIEAKDEIIKIGEDLKDLGLLKESTLEKMRGQYLPRIYLTHLLDDATVRTLQGGGRPSPSQLAYLKNRRDISKAVRELILREVKDPDYLVGRAIMIPGRDIALINWFSEIAQNPDWAYQPALATFDTLQEVENIINAGENAQAVLKMFELDPSLEDRRAELRSRIKFTQKKIATTKDKELKNQYRNDLAQLKDQLKLLKPRKVTGEYLVDEASRLRRDIIPTLEGRTKEIGEALAKRMEEVGNSIKNVAYDKREWKEMPKTKRFGKLKGMIVRREIHDDIVGSTKILESDPHDTYNNLFGEGGLTERAGQLWKWSKVAGNFPASHVRNFISNLSLMHLGGVPGQSLPGLIAKALKEMRQNGEHFRIAKKYGLKGSSFSANELGAMEKEFTELKRRLDKGEGNWMTGTFGAMKRGFDFVKDKTSASYELMEALGKTMMIIDGMNRLNMSESDAVIRAQKYLFDYSLLPGWARKIRRNVSFGSPFLTFYFKTLPILVETARKRPTKFLPYIALGMALNEGAEAVMDFDDEEAEALRQSLPDFLRNKMHVYMLPWRDENNRVMYFDASYLLPWGMFGELIQELAPVNMRKLLDGNIEYKDPQLGEALKTLGLATGPFFTAMAGLVTNKDPFTQRTIWNERDKAGAQNASKLLYAWNLVTPTMLAGLPDIFMNTDQQRLQGAVRKLYGAMNNELSNRGLPKDTVGQSAMRFFGINQYGFEPAQAVRDSLYFGRQTLKDAQRDMQIELRNLRRSGKSADQIDKRRKELMQRVIEEQVKLRKYQQATRKASAL